MAGSIDLMLCIFPFEPDLYQASGLRAVFVGHPLTASLSMRTSNAPDNRELNLVGLFPGSRQREVRKIFPVMRKAALELLRSYPQLHFEIAAASEPLAGTIRAELGNNAEKFSISSDDARELMRRAHVAMVASGTATLEAALSGLPFVLVYRVSWLTYFAARLVVKVKHLGMPNVLANREIVPEFIQHRARPREIAGAVARLLSSNQAREKMLRDFAFIAAELGQGEAAASAAEAILAELRRDRANANRSFRGEGL